MHLAYISMDELNQSLVRGWAARRGIRVQSIERVDQEPTGPYHAVLLDLDHLPPGWVPSFLSRLDALGKAHPVSAHGYAEDRDELRGRGVAVHGRLHPQVLRELALACESCALTSGEGVSDELTWINLG